MAEQLFLRITEEFEQVEAIILNGEGHLVRSVGVLPIESAALLAEGRRTVVLIPAADVISTAANVPRTSAARLRNLLPFTLEDHFAADVEDLHFAAGTRRPDGEVPVAVISRQRLERWLDILAESGIAPAAVYSESDGVPDTPSTLNLIVEGTRTLGRRPGRPAFMLEGPALEDILGLLESEREDRGDLQHVMVYLDSASAGSRQGEIDALRATTASVDVRALADGALPRLAASLSGGTGTNLLQGAYAPKSNVTALLRPWRAAAGLLLALVAVAIVGQAIELLKLSRADTVLADETSQLCSERFAASQLTSCRAEMQRRLADAGQETTSNPDSFLDTLSAVAAAATDAIEIEALSYRNRVMDIELVLPGVTELDAFSQAVAANSQFQVRMLTNTPEDDGLKSRVQVLGSDQ